MKYIFLLIILFNIKTLSAQENLFNFFDANKTTTLAINTDGTLWNICSKEKISNDNDWKSLSISGDNSDLSILIKNNGSLWGYGYRYFSGLYTGPDKFLYKIDDNNIWKKVIALEKFAIALKDDGTLWYWEYLPLDNIEKKVLPIRIGDLKIDDFNMSSSFPPFLTVLSQGKLYGMMLGDGNKVNIKDYSFTLLDETHKWKYVVTQNYSPTVLLIAEDNSIWYCKISYTNDINSIKNEIVKLKKISNENDWKVVSFYNNVILGIKNDGSVYIWSNGEFNGSPTFPSKMNLNSLPVQFFKNNKWSSAKVTDNRIVLKDEQGFLFAYGDNRFGQLCDGGTYSFSKNLVKLLIIPEINLNNGEFEYTGIKEEVSEGVIYEQIKKGDKIGYCDENKQVVFEPIFDNIKGHIKGWENGFKDVKKDGKQGIINKNGHIVIPFEYDYFWCSFGSDKNYFIIGNKNGIQYILNKDNKITYQTTKGIIIKDVFTADESKYYKVFNEELNKFGVINSFGKQIIPFEYENISLVNKENKYLKSLFYVSERQENELKKGCIGIDGKVLLPALYDDIFQIGLGQYKAKEQENEIVFDNNFKCLKGCHFIPKKPIEKSQIVKAISTTKTSANTTESKQTTTSSKPKQLSNSTTKNSNVPKTAQQNTNVKSKSETKQTITSNYTTKKYMFPYMEKRTWDSKSDIIKIEQQKNLTLVTFLFINQGYGTWSINLPGQDKPDIAFYITDKKTGRIYKTLEKESPLFKIDKGWFIITDVQFEKVPDDVKVFDLYTGDPDKNPKNAHFYNITLSEPEDMQNGINLNRILELKNTYDNTNVPLDNSEKEFYISNAKRSNVYTTPRGWQYEILQTGNGDIVNYNDEKVKLNANNCFSFKSERSKQFEKNKTFNSSFETSDYFIRTGRDCGANNAFEIPYHPNRFIPDQQAILQMHVGDKWKLFYPTYKYTNFTGNEIRVEKEIEVLEIIKAKKPIKKEIEIKNDQIFYLKGDGLNFTEALFQSETYNLENVNVFVIGQIKNTTEKTLKVQTIVNYNYAQTSGAYIFNSTDIQKIPTSFYDILQPGETKGFVTHLKLKRKSQGTNAYHYTADLDKKNPYSIETKIVTSIPQENIKSQNELITALQKNGNVPVKKTDWEEFFKKSDANIQAKNTEEKKTDSKSKSIKTESSNKISIEFREIKTNKENCGGFSYRLFDVYKNGKNYKTLKVVSHNDEWWSSCPFDCTLCTKRKKSDYTIKEFLILRHEGDDGKADNYILTEL